MTPNTPMTELPVELEPCPFCGGDALCGSTLDASWYVMCASNVCWGMTGYLETEEAAIAAWNRRTATPPAAHSPTPEHVEGDVLSVGDMETRAWEHRLVHPDGYDFDSEVTDSAEHPFGRAGRDFVEALAVVTEPLVTLTSATTRIQRAERERDEAVAKRRELLDRCVRLNNRAEPAEAQLADAVKVLNGMLAIVGDSRGVDGYHRNGDVAEWDEFPEIEDARAFLASLREKPDAERS